MTTLVELSPELTVRLLEPNDLPGMWDDLAPLIENACVWSAGEFVPSAVVDGVFSGAYRMAAFMRGYVPQSVLVLKISQLPGGDRILEVLLASGSGMKDWLKFEPQILSFAAANGCSRVRMIGREGLQKVLAHWKRTAVVLEIPTAAKELPNG